MSRYCKGRYPPKRVSKNWGPLLSCDQRVQGVGLVILDVFPNLWSVLQDMAQTLLDHETEL